MQKQLAMQLKQVLSRIAEFTLKSITSPHHFWENVVERKATIKVFPQFYLPLLIVTVLAGIAGEFLSNPEALLSFSLVYAVKQIIVFLIHFFISVYVINKLLAYAGGKENTESAQMAVGFSMGPIFLVSIITGLFPFLYPVNILGLYGLYLFYCGVPRLFEIPETRIKMFIVAAVLANFFIFASLSIIFWKLLDFIY